MWDTTLLSTASNAVSSGMDDSQWTVTTGKQNSSAGGARTGQPSLLDAFTPVATATYGAGGSSASAAQSTSSSLLPFALIGGCVLLLLVVMKHKKG